MTPISTHFEEEEVSRPPTRAEVKQEQDQNMLGAIQDFPVASTLKPSPPALSKTATYRHARQSSASISTTKGGMLPSKSLAIPFLSQGVEGNATGLMFSPRSPSFDVESSYHVRPPRHRSQASTSSIPYLSCSPSSPAESIMSGRSEHSSQSTAPSEVSKGDYFSPRKTDSSAHLPLPSQATLQDYGLYQSRPARTPSSTALHTMVGRSPPGPVSRMGSSLDSQGTISKIIQAKAQQRYASPTRRQSQDVDLNQLVPFPSSQEAGAIFFGCKAKRLLQQY